MTAHRSTVDGGTIGCLIVAFLIFLLGWCVNASLSVLNDLFGGNAYKVTETSAVQLSQEYDRITINLPGPYFRLIGNTPRIIHTAPVFPGQSLCVAISGEPKPGERTLALVPTQGYTIRLCSDSPDDLMRGVVLTNTAPRLKRWAGDTKGMEGGNGALFPKIQLPRNLVSGTNYVLVISGPVCFAQKLDASGSCTFWNESADLNYAIRLAVTSKESWEAGKTKWVKDELTKKRAGLASQKKTDQMIAAIFSTILLLLIVGLILAHHLLNRQPKADHSLERSQRRGPQGLEPALSSTVADNEKQTDSLNTAARDLRRSADVKGSRMNTEMLFDCPHCRAELKLPPNFAAPGEVVECPACEKDVVVPQRSAGVEKPACPSCATCGGTSVSLTPCAVCEKLFCDSHGTHCAGMFACHSCLQAQRGSTIKELRSMGSTVSVLGSGQADKGPNTSQEGDVTMAKKILVMEAFGHGVQPSGSEAKSVCDQYVGSHLGLDLTQARVRVNVNQMGDDQYALQHYGLLHHPGKKVEWFNYTVAGKKYLLMVVAEP